LPLLVLPMDIDHLRRTIEECSSVFREINRFYLSQEAIRSIIEKNPENRETVIVLAKAGLINYLYGTAIFDVIPIAEHIVKLDLDDLLKTGDIVVIDKIRHGHGIRSKKGKEIDFYSFSTKYTFFHNPRSFPMYDNLIMRLLCHLNKDCNFHSRFTQNDLRDYPTYKAVIDALAMATGLTDRLYREFDHGLWVYAKYRYSTQSLKQEEKAIIEGRLPADMRVN